MIKKYYLLIKPERTFTNVLTAAAGYLFATKWQIDWSLLGALIIGITFVIASAGVLNNYVDRGLDQKMERTKHRALASGKITVSHAITFGVILAIASFGLLLFTNTLTFAIIAVAFLGYVLVYGLAKRRTVYSTLIGTVPGGASLVAGYTAFTNMLDGAALALFLIMLGWQMVHFYAIAIYRRKDYAAAGIPIISVKKGVETTKLHMWFYLVIFVVSAAFLTFAGYTGYIYLAAVLSLGFVWGRMAFRGFKTTNNEQWARNMFKTSLSVLVLMVLFLSLGPLLP